MGGQRRYKVPMFDTNYRVLRILPDDKEELLFSSNVFKDAEAEYKRLSVNTTDTIFFMHRTLIVKRNDRT